MRGIVEQTRNLLKTRRILNARSTKSNAVKTDREVNRHLCKLAVFDTADISTGNQIHTRKIDHLRETFTALKNDGIKIAICTSDDRENALKKIRSSGLESLIDITKCDQDPALLPKPHPSNIDSICADTGVRPANIIMVGGKAVDIQLGKNAKVGLTIAIRNDETCNTHLEADETITNIEEVVNILRRQVHIPRGRVQLAS